MQTLHSRNLGPALKQWLWSHRAIWLGVPLFFSSAASLHLAPLPEPITTVDQELLADLSVTAPPTLAWDLTVTPTDSSPVSSTQALPTDEPTRPQAEVVGHTSASSSPPAKPQSLSLSAQLTPPENLPAIPVRIGIARRTSQLQLSTSTSAFVMDAAGQQLAELSANTGVSVQPGSSGLIFGNLQLPDDVWIKTNADGFIAINGRWYRGSVQILQDRQRLVAVNHLDLETYLYSVVGAEMSPSWPMEALKAQAIAARSYALARISSNPASPFYDLGDTPRWQAYPGLKTEANRTHLAVDSTRGLLISHQGAVVESLYASTIHLVRKVHKGYGMSQNGARDLAQRQFDYQQILNHFYPGTTLTWLQAS
ncbi:SpoIID/LytB domain-containing protein [Acaryochloris thomasi]|nr:SpoIID/LytB domain-containing protein [Acaryochloris thomasi]